MALCKEIVKHNFTANYHRIGEITLHDNALVVCLESYASEEDRQLNMLEFYENYTFGITLEEEESMGIRQIGYAKLKTLPEWADSEDC